MATGNSEFKEVDFNTWCKKCKYRYLPEKMDPCNDCLEVGMREGTSKPEHYTEK